MKKILLTLALMAAVAACEPSGREIERGRNPESGALAMTHDDDRLLIAAEDHNQLLIVDRVSKKVTARVDVGEGPAHVIELEDGRAVVTNRYGNSVSVVNVEEAKVEATIAVGSEPYGLVEVSKNRLAVALSGEGRLALVDLDARAVTQKIDLVDLDPRAVARLKDGSLYVSHMATGRFSRVDLSDHTVTAVDIRTRNDFGPQLHAEHLRSITVDDEGAVLVAHTQANADTVRAPIGDPSVQDPGGQGSCGYSGCATELGAVEPGLTEIDPDTDTVVVPQQQQVARDSGGMEADCFDCGVPGGLFVPNPPSILNPREARFGGVQIQNPAAVALFDGGKGQIVVNLGSKNALLLRRDLKGVAGDVLGVVKLGNGAQSVAVSHDGDHAYVWNQFDATLSEIELPEVKGGTESQTKFDDGTATTVTSDELTLAPELAAETVTLLEDALTPDVSFGRKIFHDATNAQVASNGTVSCASCHPDGRTDGRTWQFVFGPRNTPQLGGGILDTAPFHWPGDVPTVPALNDMTVLPFMGGSGLPSESFELVASFIDSIRSAPAPTALAGLSEQELRGKAIFESEQAQCTTCHGGSHFTDNRGWDVGTKASSLDIAVFQTPVLHGLARSAPYLHDGSAQTLRQLVDNLVTTDRMGVGSHLGETEIEDLVAYLKTL
jgi:YVTN family beta-propeller protein